MASSNPFYLNLAKINKEITQVSLKIIHTKKGPTRESCGGEIRNQNFNQIVENEVQIKINMFLETNLDSVIICLLNFSLPPVKYLFQRPV